MQALRTAPLAAEHRPPYHTLLDEWLASLPDSDPEHEEEEEDDGEDSAEDDDVEKRSEDDELPPELVSGGINVTIFYIDQMGQVPDFAA